MKLAWVDVETSGLDFDQDVLLEIAIAITDPDLNIIDDRSWIIKPDKMDLMKWDPVVRSMHLKNGLIQEIGLMKDVHSARYVQEEALKFLSHYIKAKESPLCGSTVHFDRRFLEAEMPELEKHFHYRNIDVSTLKQLVQMWYPNSEPWVKKDVHRALPDVQDSIKELYYYRNVLKGKA